MLKYVDFLMLKYLILIHTIDRVVRNYDDTKEQWEYMNNAELRKELDKTFIADLTITHGKRVLNHKFII